MRVFALFGRPAFLRAFHAYATITWAALAIPSMLWWRNSLPYLVGLSVSWQACRIETAQDEALERSH